MVILYIDDDADDREILTEAIHEVNPSINIAYASNGREGLQFLELAKTENSLPCLVVLDINMPILDGKKTLELIREEASYSNLPVVIFSSSQNMNDKEFYTARASDFISKPISPSALPGIVQRMLQYCN